MNYLKATIRRFTLLKLLPVLIISIVGFSCARTVQAHTLPRNNSAQSTKIYIFRPSVYGTAIDVKIYENQSIAGQLGTRSYLAWETNAGAITLEGKSGLTSDRNVGFVKINAQAGKTYYLKLQPKTALKTTYEFIRISEAEAAKLIAKLKEPKIKVVS